MHVYWRSLTAVQVTAVKPRLDIVPQELAWMQKHQRRSRDYLRT